MPPEYRQELQSLIDYGAFDESDPQAPKLPAGHPFTGVQSSHYWSSTTRADGTTRAWYVYFYDGYVYFDFKDFNYYVWPVRGGQ